MRKRAWFFGLSAAVFSALAAGEGRAAPGRLGPARGPTEGVVAPFAPAGAGLATRAAEAAVLAPLAAPTPSSEASLLPPIQAPEAPSPAALAPGLVEAQAPRIPALELEAAGAREEAPSEEGWTLQDSVKVVEGVAKALGENADADKDPAGARSQQVRRFDGVGPRGRAWADVDAEIPGAWERTGLSPGAPRAERESAGPSGEPEPAMPPSELRIDPARYTTPLTPGARKKLAGEAYGYFLERGIPVVLVEPLESHDEIVWADADDSVIARAKLTLGEPGYLVTFDDVPAFLRWERRWFKRINGRRVVAQLTPEAARRLREERVAAARDYLDGDAIDAAKIEFREWDMDFHFMDGHRVRPARYVLTFDDPRAFRRWNRRWFWQRRIDGIEVNARYSLPGNPLPSRTWRVLAAMGLILLLAAVLEAMARR